ncbi:MAG: hypothetical protein LBT04_04535 [Prevotellaceae bacterium]|jgi:hypothetical protein|nr:hypothetical protein [Prevotellaceae bacterium]
MLKKAFLLTLSIPLVCCSKYKNTIPNYPVHLEFNITANAPELAAFNGFKEFFKPENATQVLGYGGILVFHTIEDKYCAFDMACPFEAKPDIRVHADNMGVAKCDSCLSTFYTGDATGFQLDGKAKSPLRKYQTYFNPTTNNILVTN